MGLNVPPAIAVVVLGVVGGLILRLLRWLAGDGAGFRVVQTGNRGKILVSRGSHEPGSVILTEKAILSVAGGSPLAALGRLSKAQRRRLELLHRAQELDPESLGAELGCHGEHLLERMAATGIWTPATAQKDAVWVWQLLCVWDANKLSFVNSNGPEQCVFEKISRFNHSCEPNVRLLPSGKPGELVAVAALRISHGEELCICYPERNLLPMLHFLYAPAPWRRAVLQRWRFECRCPRCAAEDLAFHRLDGEQELEEAAMRLVPELQQATSCEDFPVAAVLELLEQCAAQGLGADHWLTFWLLSLVSVGCSGQLQAAALGVARAAALPSLGALALAAAALDTPPGSGAARLLRERPGRRPLATRRLAEYLDFTGAKEEQALRIFAEPVTSLENCEEMLRTLAASLEEEEEALNSARRQLQLSAQALEAEAAEELAASTEAEARLLVAGFAARAQEVGAARLFQQLSREKAPLALEAAEKALGSSSGSSAKRAAKRAAELLDLNGSGWIEEADFREAMERFRPLQRSPSLAAGAAST
ncbi:unnamed protein product [Effrenium voratum]|nr:unnamed protein product [Effrenium voratum]